MLTEVYLIKKGFKKKIENKIKKQYIYIKCLC